MERKFYTYLNTVFFHCEVHQFLLQLLKLRCFCFHSCNMLLNNILRITPPFRYPILQGCLLFFLDLDATNIWWYVCWWQIITVFAKLHNTRGMRSTSVWFMLVTTCSTNVGAVVVAILVRWIQILHWSKMLNSCCKNASTSRNKYCTYTIHEYHLVSYLCIMLRTSSCILQIKSNK